MAAVHAFWSTVFVAAPVEWLIVYVAAVVALALTGQDAYTMTLPAASYTYDSLSPLSTPVFDTCFSCRAGDHIVAAVVPITQFQAFSWAPLTHLTKASRSSS
ncbi:hypothetical protein ACIBL3_26975 [Kribbella sp. NPDC050124]|uniref:hypothetical protein n=1 Tax=Kribbella sp. NPDC050124 TaxID=3364114 RepID=UPI00378807DC